MFAKYSVPEYWIIDPVGNTLEIYSNAGDSYELIRSFGERDEVESPTFPGLRFQASRVFED